jgi:uncharacterized protein (DUF302 family)
MNPSTQKLGMSLTLHATMEEAQSRVTDALKSQGFGILTEINVQDTLKQKIGVDVHPYKILGACNPVLAHRALTAVPEVGLLLPCNVTLSENEAGEVLVSIIDPIMMMQVVEHPELESVANEARSRLESALASLLS